MANLLSHKINGGEVLNICRSLGNYLIQEIDGCIVAKFMKTYGPNKEG
ncbi:hypothetical protein IC582_000784 [Cucumis melo]